MSAREFLEQLEGCLSRLPAEERENAMAYYREYFMEAGEDKEDEAAASLGSPQSVAERIINESEEALSEVVYREHEEENVQSAPVTEEKIDPAHTVLMILLIIISSPIWLAAFIVIIAFCFAIACVPVSLGVSSLAVLVQGIVEICTGEFGYAIMDIGSAAAIAGFVMLIWQPVFKLTGILEGSIKKFFKTAFNRRNK